MQESQQNETLSFKSVLPYAVEKNVHRDCSTKNRRTVNAGILYSGGGGGGGRGSGCVESIYSCALCI